MNEVDIDALKNRTNGHSTSITNLTNTTNNHTTQINSHGKRITSLEGTVSSFDARIKNSEQQSNEALSKINGFDQRITDANDKSELALEGVALAMALADPVLSGDSTFGLRGNWGNFEGRSAWGVSAIGILHQNVFGNGEKFGLAGSIGATESGDVGGRVGAQLTWK